MIIVVCFGSYTLPQLDLTQKSKTSSSSYHIWHKHPPMIGKWLCGKCYANLLFEPKRKFKTNVMNISIFGSGDRDLV